MANHGAIAYGASVEQAIELSLLLEWACTVYWRARALGEPSELDEEQRAAVVAAAVERGYGTTREVSHD
jgi:L-fuculose-phosphate aldolase